jgi:hypothetical protein
VTLSPEEPGGELVDEAVGGVVFLQRLRRR